MISDMHRFSVIVIILSGVSFEANCLYFHIAETENKCFLQELPTETLFVGHYRCQLYDSKGKTTVQTNTSVGMHVEIHDPQKKLMLSRWYSSEGKFSFISHSPGEHTICLHSNSTKQSDSGGKVRVYLDFQTGEHAINYQTIANNENLTELETKLRQLIDQAEQIAKEQDYQRYREEMFRGTTECISMRVLLWSIGQTIILVVMGVWQMQNLREFLESKKLV